MKVTSELATYRRLFDNMVHDIELLLEDLPAEALLWKPFEHSPWRGPAGSLGWLIAHAISSTYYLLRRAEWMMGRLDWDAVDGDEGSEEFGPANHDPAYLLARARRMQTYVHQFLASLSSQDLDASRPHPLEPDRILTAREDIQHAFEHMSRHIGHAELTRQLWALKATKLTKKNSSLQNSPVLHCNLFGTIITGSTQLMFCLNYSARYPSKWKVSRRRRQVLGRSNPPETGRCVSRQGPKHPVPIDTKQFAGTQANCRR